MALFLTESDVRSLLTMDIALDAVEEAFRGLYDGTAINQPRHRLKTERGLFHVMASVVASRQALGFKAYASLGGRVNFLIALYHSETDELLAMIEGDWLGRMRTGAASGVATKYMARPDAKTLGLFGSGGQARTQLSAVCAVRPIEKVLVYSRDPQKRAAFVADMQPQVNAQVIAVDSPTAALESADVIVTATTSSEPVFAGDGLPEGAHINATGSNHLKRREIDRKTIRRCPRIAVDSLEQAKIECGDLAQAVEDKILDWDDVIEFAHIVGGDVPGRTSPEERTLFESQGLSVWDIATAARVVELAKERRVGCRVAMFE